MHYGYENLEKTAVLLTWCTSQLQMEINTHSTIRIEDCEKEVIDDNILKADLNCILRF